MKSGTIGKTSIWLLLFGTLLLAVTAAVQPVLSAVFAVGERKSEAAAGEAPEIPAVPAEAVGLQVVYVMEDGTKEISQAYLEIRNEAAKKVWFLTIPAETKLELSQTLYQELLTYAPTLPQYVSLSKAAEEFSEEYGPEGCTRILAEVLGIPLKHWSCGSRETFGDWKQALSEKSAETDGFFRQWQAWLLNTGSGQSDQERRLYYESYRDAEAVWQGRLPGTEGVGTYRVDRTSSRLLVEELMRKSEEKIKEGDNR